MDAVYGGFSVCALFIISSGLFILYCSLHFCGLIIESYI